MAIVQDFFVRAGVIVQGTNRVTAATGNTGTLQVNGGAAVAKNLIVGEQGQFTGGVVALANSTLTSVSASGVVTISNNTAASSTATGALVVTGGVGIGGDLRVGGTLYATISGSITTATNLDGGATGSIPYQTGVGLTSFIPIGSTNSILQSNGTTATWVSTTTLTVQNAMTAANIRDGSAGQLVYQTGAGATSFVAAGTAGTVLVSNGTSAPSWNNTLALAGTTAATSTTTGALTVAGGVGIQGSLYVGGEIVAQKLTIEYTTVTTTLVQTDDIIQTTNNTQSTDSTTGALKVTGGAGIGGNVNVGGNLTVNGTSTFVGAITGTISSANNLTGGATGSVPYQSATGTTVFVSIGSEGQVLTVNSGLPVWQNASGVAAGSATTATNLAGGSQYQIPYQTGSGLTGFEAGFEYNYTSNTFSVDNVVVNGTTDATTTATGALQVKGGVGIGGAIVVGGAGNVAGDLTVGGDVSVNGGDLITNQTTFNLVNTTATTVNFAGAATALTIGATTGATTVRNDTVVSSITGATSTATGALQVRGGVGINENLYVGGTLNVTGRSTLGEVSAGATTATSLNVTGTASVGGVLTASNSTDSTAPNNGSLVVTGGAGIGKALVVGGAITAGVTAAATTGTTVSGLFSNNALLATFTSNPISGTGTANLDTFAKATYRSAKYFVQIVDGSNVHITEISVFHDGSNVYMSEYATHTNNGQLGTFDATLGGTDVTLTFTPSPSATAMVIKVVRMTVTA